MAYPTSFEPWMVAAGIPQEEELRPQRAKQIAWAFHETLLEVLRRLNQAEEERPELKGLEYVELERMLSRFWAVEFAEAHLNDAVALLLENGLMRDNVDPQYVWDRGRVVGRYYSITTLGKSYLAHSLEDDGRIR